MIEDFYIAKAKLYLAKAFNNSFLKTKDHTVFLAYRNLKNDLRDAKQWDESSAKSQIESVTNSSSYSPKECSL